MAVGPVKHAVAAQRGELSSVSNPLKAEGLLFDESGGRLDPKGGAGLDLSPGVLAAHRVPTRAGGIGRSRSRIAGSPRRAGVGWITGNAGAPSRADSRSTTSKGKSRRVARVAVPRLAARRVRRAGRESVRPERAPEGRTAEAAPPGPPNEAEGQAHCRSAGSNEPGAVEPLGGALLWYFPRASEESTKSTSPDSCPAYVASCATLNQPWRPFPLP